MSNLNFLEIYPKIEIQPSCVRVKVLLDVHDPIPLGFLLPDSINGVDWISFVFEYLSVFCFKCGFIGHHIAACNVTEEGHGNEVRVSPGGQRFQFYSSKTRVVPKPIGDHFVFGFSLLFGTDLNQPLLPLITNVGDSSVNSKLMNTNAEPTKGPMIIDISSSQLNATVGLSNDHEWQTAQDQLPLTVEAHNPGQMGIYTWTNRQNGRHRIWERIDRMMANEVWRSRFSYCRVLHELATSSDHKFLILKLIQDRVNVRRPFRFEIMWAQHGGCQEQIQDAFQHELRGSPSFVLCKKLQNCQKNLRWWNKHVFGEVEHKLEVVKQRLSEIQSLIENATVTEELFLVQNDLILEHNDILVQQANH
ncbi:hypothetical protein IFM89_003562 [Coptis chinensis]|uniref:Zinc knuckle CX2CX4HX4C domain-containing protein n=1 Tax=Coptis chinensis TaxID=261450 RepID=A0A835I2H2_9MAGN|nr:hypothetical protein IFM89_003562 [Coptis chinensis]